MNKLIATAFIIISTQSFAQTLELACQLQIRKTFSEGGPARLYHDNSIVTITMDELTKDISIKGVNYRTSISSNMPTSHCPHLFDNSTKINWDLEQHCGSGNFSSRRTKISISRTTGILHTEDFTEITNDGWIRTTVQGTCQKTSVNQLKF